ncbi:hypothetical protein BCO18175_00989 [Burkholderia contaminans]|uniref:hypothetical protein n=1 Tax=Burkholderia contaminans TaxID=488447 RepID=UPI000B2FAF7D|nr:hypothetical protein [Burkholderia contaminans]VWC60731.1 hypothetical protein BCO18175_00989 [Burkholderia contaminans]
MITGYRLKKGGFLQADILLTSTKSTRMRPSQIPSFNPGTDCTPLKNRTVAGLCQKILVVNEHFAVAFAGSVAAIQNAARLIASLLAQCPDLTGKRFVDAILADEQLKEAQLTAIVLSVEDDEIQITTHRAVPGISNEHFELHVGGSGKKHAIEHYEQFPLQVFDVSWDDIAVQGTCMALYQFAHHVIDEFENKFEAETITDLFGGGYEVVAYHGGQFHKISDVVYVYAEAEVDADGILQIDLPKFMLKSTYRGDDLKIRSMELHYDEHENNLTIQSDRTFTIAPITRYRETHVEEGCKDINLSGEFLCFLIKVKQPTGSFTIPFIRKYHGILGFAVKAFNAIPSKNKVYFIYSETFRSELQAHVLEYMRLRHP